MKRASLAPLVVLLLSCSARGQEVPLNSSIESVELFKNGLAIVHRSADITAPGVYRLDNVPAPVHGTFWITGDVAMDAQVTMRDVDVPANNSPEFQQNLIGKNVKIQLREAALPPVVGRVVKLDRPKGNQAWNRTYEQPQYDYQDNSQPQTGGFLVIETDHGRTYIDSSMIAFMDVTDAGPNIHQRQPVLLLTPRDGNKGTVHISYLTKGLAWAPSYRVELIDDHNLSVEQQAVVKNEMQDFKDAEVTLISGYPNIRYSNVLSPLSLEQNWARFFEQINANPAEARGAMSNSAMAQAPTPNADDFTSGLDLSAIPAGEGADLHFQSIGKHSLGEGDSLLVSVAQNTAPYDRIVEWIVADNRDVDGRTVEVNRNGDSTGPPRNQPWDAIRFKNPLPFAMTTGPAMILDGGHFAGQSLSYWVNSGEETTMRVTQALSIRTRATEFEERDNNRQTVLIGASTYRKVNVTGQLTVNNHRRQDVSMVIRRQFSGDLIKADGDPKTVLREEGVYSVNRRNELVWTIPLKGGEEKTLTYEYAVLIYENG